MNHAVSVSYVSQKGEAVMACFYGNDRDAVVNEGKAAAGVFRATKGVTAVRLTDGPRRAANWRLDGGKVYWRKVG